jgi:DNA-binding transcriptional MocR family regulator
MTTPSDVQWAAVVDGWLARPGPLYQRLADALRLAVQHGRIVSGSRLAPERSLATTLGVSRSTVVAAYDDLASSGWVERRQGSGTWVAASAPRRTRVMTLRTPAAVAADELDFTVAVPWLDAAQEAELREASVDAWSDSRYHPLGLPELREAIAASYTQGGLATHPDQVVVTTGAQQAIALTVSAFVRPGDACVLETPTFFGAIDACRSAGARLVGVPVGTGPAAWTTAAADLGDAFEQHSPRWVFLTPTFQNPTGALMPTAVRRAVADLVSRHEVPLVEDETLADLSFGTGTPPSIASLAAPDAPVISVGSLSKLYWAGLRVGWLRAPENLVPRLAQSKTLADFGTSSPSQRVALRLVADLPRLRRDRRLRALPSRDLLVALLREQLPSWRFDVPDGGQFLWVELPTSNATAYTQVAARYGVRVFPGVAMAVGGAPDTWLRLPFTMPTDVLPEAVSRMAAAWDEFVRRDASARLS